jgi:anti-anti-sigma regulatory factor
MVLPHQILHLSTRSSSFGATIAQIVMRISSIGSAPPKVDDTLRTEPLGAGETAARRADGLIPTRDDFALAVERLGNETAALVLAGELDLYRAPEIEQALARATEAERDGERHGQTCGAPSAGDAPSSSKGVRVAVDLRSVTFLDSTTLLLLLEASQRERARGGELLILVGPQTPTTAFEVTGFDRLLTIRRVHADLNGSPA